MSLPEIKETLVRLSADERFEVAKFLRSLGEIDDPEWMAELDRRCERVKNGNGFGSAELAALDRRLRAEGR